MNNPKHKLPTFQDEDLLGLKQEANTLMVTLDEENEFREEDLNNQQLQTQSFNDGQDEEEAASSLTAEPRIIIDRKHVRKTVRIHSCKVCRKSYTAAHSLKCHMRVHTGERPYSCKECCKSFSQSSHLTTHMITHTGAKMFSCRLCGKRFSQSHHLGSHMRTHSGEKPFSCSECDKSFTQSSNLTRHMKTHSRGGALFHVIHGHQ
uniref:C2H2-type domain-containing protein n=1 Tax=Oryzias latipes TaxID=8090 RepID=A0A3P9JPF4_ORYLA